MTETSGPLPLRVATAADDADRAVLTRISSGDLHALDELYDRYKTMSYSIAYRITSDPTLAEDVVQDAFLGVWRNAARYLEGRGSVKTWLLSIVHHRAIDAVRRRRPTVRRRRPSPSSCPTSGPRSRPRSMRTRSAARSRCCPMSSARRSSWPTSA